MVFGRWTWVSRLGDFGGISSVGFIGKKRANLVNATRHGSQTPREERFAYARLLAYMARIDNELTVDEMAMFEQRLGTALLSLASENPFVLRSKTLQVLRNA